MRTRSIQAPFCQLCGVRLIAANKARAKGPQCRVCATSRGRREARKAENRRRVQIAGFLPANFWK
jgi:hypothetical protein